MARTGYHDFLDDARETFGLDYYGARELYEDMRDTLGYSLDAEDLADYGDLASDLLFIGPEGEDDFEDYMDYLDYGDEIEISAALTYDET